MSNQIDSARDFREKLFKVINSKEMKETVGSYLQDNHDKRTRRTNLFLGSAGRIKNWGERRNKKNCLLKKLHAELYPNLSGYPVPPDLADLYEDVDHEDLVWFESMGFDCIFLPYRRLRPKKNDPGYPYPIAWTNDWVIEVENVFEEFAFTLRGLLDINCRNRMGLFFTNLVTEGLDQFLEITSSAFSPTWELFTQTESKDGWLQPSYNINALTFPDTFKDVVSYCDEAVLMRWNEQDSFVIL